MNVVEQKTFNAIINTPDDAWTKSQIQYLKARRELLSGEMLEKLNEKLGKRKIKNNNDEDKKKVKDNNDEENNK